MRLRKDVAAHPPVTWIAPENAETPLVYYKRVPEIGTNKKLPLAWRQGGGSCLGVQENKNHAWQLSGIPSTWGPTTLRDWLVKTGWKVEPHMKPPSGRHPTWSMQGHCVGKPLQQSFAYEVQCGSKPCHVLITRWHRGTPCPKASRERCCVSWPGYGTHSGSQAARISGQSKTPPGGVVWGNGVGWEWDHKVAWVCSMGKKRVVLFCLYYVVKVGGSWKICLEIWWNLYPQEIRRKRFPIWGLHILFKWAMKNHQLVLIISQVCSGLKHQYPRNLQQDPLNGPLNLSI